MLTRCLGGEKTVAVTSKQIVKNDVMVLMYAVMNPAGTEQRWKDFGGGQRIESHCEYVHLPLN